MKIYNCLQGSDEWIHFRLGIPTASEFDRIVTPGHLRYSAAAHKYMCVKLAEWLTGEPLEGFVVSLWMDRGAQLEPEAVRYYEMEKGVDTTAVGIMTTDDGMIGASPDRLVGDDGLLELKCPALETHIAYMLDPRLLVSDYRIQIQGQLWVCERDWTDVQSYHPGLPAVIVRVVRDEEVADALREHVGTFVERMLAARKKLRKEDTE